MAIKQTLIIHYSTGIIIKYHNMKAIIILLFTILSNILSNHNMHHKTLERGLVVKSTLIGYYDPSEIPLVRSLVDSSCCFLIEVKLINYSNDTIEFITYTCLPGRMVVLDSKDFKLWLNICIDNNNFPMKLKPGQEYSFPILLVSNKSNDNRFVRIGWIYLNSQNTLDIDDFFDQVQIARTNQTHVVWSNQVYLAPSSGIRSIVK